MKTQLINHLAHRVLGQAAIRSRRRQPPHGGPMASPSSSVSSEIASLRGSRSGRIHDAADTLPRRSAALSRTTSGSIEGSARAPQPGPSGTLDDRELSALIHELETLCHGSVEVAQQRLGAARNPVIKLEGHVEVRPQDAPDHRPHAKNRAAYFNAMAQQIMQLAAHGEIHLGSSDYQQLEDLLKFSEELDQSVERNIFTGADAHQHRAHRVAALDMQAQQALQNLMHGHLPELLPKITDPDHLQQLATDLLKLLVHSPVQRARLEMLSPALVKSLDDVEASIRKDIRLAGSEFNLQWELLTTVGAAMLKLGEGKIDGLAGGLNHTLRRLLPRPLARKLGIDMRSRAHQVRDSIDNHLGPYYDVKVSKEHKDRLDMSLKTTSVGQVTTAALEEQFSSLAQKSKARTKAEKRPAFFPEAVRAAANLHPHLAQVQLNGQAQVRLSEEARKRLDDLRLEPIGEAAAAPTHQALHHLLARGAELAAGLLEQHTHEGTGRHQRAITQANEALRTLAHLADMPPRDRMALAASRALEAAQFGVLKLSLLQSFSTPIAGKILDGENRWQINQPLTQKKAHLLANTLEAVLGSPSQEHMLASLADAERKHGEILREARQPVSSGETAELLKSLRLAVERY